MFSIETVEHFIGRCRSRIDEEADVDANFWSDAEWVEYLNEGVREVWQAVRETHQNWFTRTMTSTDSIVRIGGREYNPDALRLTNRRERLALPPDFRELLFIEGLPPPNSTEIGDNFFPTIRFEYRNMTQRRFREDALNFVTTNVRVYLYDVEFTMNGPYIIFSPPLSLNEDISCRIKYVCALPQLRKQDTFENLGLTLEMVDAVLMYCVWAAGHKENVIDPNTLGSLERRWNLKRELAVRAAGPKQTRDEEVVEGYLEDEEL